MAPAMRPNSTPPPAPSHTSPSSYSVNGMQRSKGELRPSARNVTVRAWRLRPRQARALAGEWYDWFITRHPISELQKWEALRGQVHDALREAIGDDQWEQNNPDDLWLEDEEFRTVGRPILADVGETAQFLGMKRMALNNEARNRFLDFLYDDLAAVFRRLIGIARGDYSPDGYRENFPKFEGTDSGVTPSELFEKWVAARKPASGTVESWRYVFRAIAKHFKDRSAASITDDEAQQWVESLVTTKRSAQSVNKTGLKASKTVFAWALEHKHIPRNPFKGVKITVPEKVQSRETRAFYPEEWRPILRAALEITDTRTPYDAVRRWVPWLCAYTGARVGEITQLRKTDVFKREGIWAIRITPDAGTVKNKKARVVPLHEHLIEQGFLKFVADRGSDGPLFYNPAPAHDAGALAQSKPRYAQARQRLAAWVRSLGVSDAELQPNHAWRHTFKQIADHAHITERMSDYITGHASRSVGARYGAPVLSDMADALKAFPRFNLEQETKK